MIVEIPTIELYFHTQYGLFYDDLILRLSEGETRTGLILNFTENHQQNSLFIKENFGFDIQVRCPETILWIQDDNIYIELEEYEVSSVVISLEGILLEDTVPGIVVIIPPRTLASFHITLDSISISVSVEETNLLISANLTFVGECEIVGEVLTRIFALCDITYQTSLMEVINSMGLTSITLIKAGIQDVKLQKILLQYGTYLVSLFNLVNEVKGAFEGKTSSFIQPVKNDFSGNFGGMVALLNSSESFSGNSNLLGTISKGLNLIQQIELSLSAGFIENQMILNPIGLQDVLILQNNILEATNSFIQAIIFIREELISNQVITNELGNDYLVGINSILGSFETMQGNSFISLSIAQGLQLIQTLRQKIEGDYISQIQNNITSFEAMNDSQRLLGVISESLLSLQKINLALSTDTILNQSIINSFPNLTEVNVQQNPIVDGINEIQSLVNTLSHSLQEGQVITNELSVLSDLLSLQLHRLSLSELGVHSFSQDYNVFLDGENINKYIKGDLKITYTQTSIHNSITFSSISEELFIKADPSYFNGEVRIEVQIGSRVMYFLLEERSGSMDGTIEYWGRDGTARDSSPWASPTYVLLDEWRSAKEVCESLPLFCAINWEIQDWLLPTNFEASGTPMDIIQTIVSEIGALIRAQDDGSLTIRHPYPVRPVDLVDYYSADPIEYPPHLISNLSYDETVGAKYNIVTVSCDTKDKEAPTLALEDLESGGDRIVGTDSVVRVYWNEEPPEITNKSEIWNFSTDGNIELINVQYEEHSEFITFADGVGSVQFPIYELLSVRWIGKSSSVESCKQYSKEIILSNILDYKIAEVTYKTEFCRYKIFDHDVEMLLASWTINSSFNWAERIITPPIAKDQFRNLVDREGEDIVVNYLTDKTALIKRGENWIDQNKRDYITISLDSPYKDDIVDGKPVWLDADRIIAGYYHVIAADIVINGAKVVNSIQGVRWEV